MTAAEVLVDDVASTRLVTVRRPAGMIPVAFGQSIVDLEELGYVRAEHIDTERAIVERTTPSETRARRASLPLGSATSHPADAPTEPDPREGLEVAYEAARADETRDVVSSDEASEIIAMADVADDPEGHKTARGGDRAEAMQHGPRRADAPARGRRGTHAATRERPPLQPVHSEEDDMPKKSTQSIAERIRTLIGEGCLTTAGLVEQLGEKHTANIHVTTGKLVNEGVLRRREKGVFTFHGWKNGSGGGQAASEASVLAGLEALAAEARNKLAAYEDAIRVLRGE